MAEGESLLVGILLGCRRRLIPISANAAEAKRDFHLACNGLHTYEASNKPVAIQSSFYFGSLVVEHNGLPFRICSESSSQITFANDCSKPTIIGELSVALRHIRMQVLSPKVDASLLTFNCQERSSLR